MSESVKRTVTQLLKDYRAFKTAFGGAAEINFESKGEYGPAGMILEGASFDREHIALMRESLSILDGALDRLKTEDMSAYIALISPYLGDPADPSLVDDWRRKSDRYVSARLFLKRHDQAINLLSAYLKHEDLFAVFPKRMTSREETNVKRRNDEFHSLYEKLKQDGETKTRAVNAAADMCGYGRTRAWEIVKLREADTG